MQTWKIFPSDIPRNTRVPAKFIIINANSLFVIHNSSFVIQSSLFSIQNHLYSPPLSAAATVVMQRHVARFAAGSY